MILMSEKKLYVLVDTFVAIKSDPADIFEKSLEISHISQ